MIIGRDALSSLDNGVLFQRVDGFAIEFFRRSGWELRFVDGAGRVVARFAWWTDVDRDLRRWTIAGIPLGDVAQPYVDSDQCWEIVIWRDGERVFVAEGDGDENFARLRWIPADDYTEAWSRALAFVRALPE